MDSRERHTKCRKQTAACARRISLYCVHPVECVCLCIEHVYHLKCVCGCRYAHCVTVYPRVFACYPMLPCCQHTAGQMMGEWYQICAFQAFVSHLLCDGKGLWLVEVLQPPKIAFSFAALFRLIGYILIAKSWCCMIKFIMAWSYIFCTRCALSRVLLLRELVQNCAIFIYS